MSVPKIQIGQLWKKDGTGDTYLVTRVYSEALSTMVILRKSGSEEEALTADDNKHEPGGDGAVHQPGYPLLGEIRSDELAVQDRVDAKRRSFHIELPQHSRSRRARTEEVQGAGLQVRGNCTAERRELRR